MSHTTHAHAHTHTHTLTSSNTGSHCSRKATASDLPITSPALLTPRYRPYPDLRAILFSDNWTKVKISASSGPSSITNIVQ